MPKYCLKQLPSNSTPGLGTDRRIRFYALLHSQNKRMLPDVTGARIASQKGKSTNLDLPEVFAGERPLGFS